jgi:hypothetical protein
MGRKSQPKSYTIFFGPEEQETLDGLHLEARRRGVTLHDYLMHVLSYAVSSETRAYLATARRAEPANNQQAA